MADFPGQFERNEIHNPILEVESRKNLSIAFQTSRVYSLLSKIEGIAMMVSFFSFFFFFRHVSKYRVQITECSLLLLFISFLENCVRRKSIRTLNKLIKIILPVLLNIFCICKLKFFIRIIKNFEIFLFNELNNFLNQVFSFVKKIIIHHHSLKENYISNL